tara:strand:+ start:506 stop:1297 length:792 start_codon:yes stop_codon:yes gene_type:complete
MRLHKEYTYLFHDIDRHGVRINHTSGMLLNDFTALIRFKPDLDQIFELLEERKDDPEYSSAVYVKQCLFGKNGKHTGLFLTTFIDETNLVKHFIEYEWWQNPNWAEDPDPSKDEVKKASVNVEPELDGWYDVCVTKYNNKVTVKVHSIGEDTVEVNGLIDYSKSLMWCGSATGLPDGKGEINQEFQCLFTGDVTMLHMQEATMSEDRIKLAFVDYPTLREKRFDVLGDVIYISTNFEETTALKARDYSGNGMHLLKYNKEWIS